MSARELAERLALEAIEPVGERRADYRAAVICWTIACCNWSGKGARPDLKNYLKLFEFGESPQADDEDLPPALAALAKKQ